MTAQELTSIWLATTNKHEPSAQELQEFTAAFENFNIDTQTASILSRKWYGSVQAAFWFRAATNKFSDDHLRMLLAHICCDLPAQLWPRLD